VTNTKAGARGRDAIAGVLLVLAVLLTYLPAIGAGYVWDDDVHVTANETLRTVEGLYRIWFVAGATPQYYPLVFTSFWLEHHAWGLRPLGYHLDNVLLHALNALLVWIALRRLRVPGAWLAAGVFALHPINVESVAWITERKNVLSGCFYLGALIAYLRSLPADVRGTGAASHGRRWYLLSLLLFACALLSKTVTGTLPAALLLILWWKGRPITWRGLRALSPMFLFAVLMGLNTIQVERVHILAVGEEWSLSWAERFLVAGRALWFYAGRILAPHRFTFIYPRFEIDSASLPQYVYPLSALAVMTALWLLRRRIGRGPVTAALFFAGTLFPALGFFDIYPMRFSFVADHFQYLAGLGLIAPAAVVAARLVARLGAGAASAGALALVALLPLAALSWRQAAVYEDARTLWSDTLEKNPGAWIAWNNLGLLLFQQGDEDAALAHYERAIELNPRYPEAQYNLGMVLARRGRLEEARRHLATSASLRPDNPGTRLQLGLVLARLDRLADSEKELRAAIDLSPASPDANLNLGVVLARQGRMSDAAARFGEAVRLDPGSKEARYNLGLALAQTEDVKGAAESFLASLRIDPSFSEAGRQASSIAWVLSTHPDPRMRDGALALELARAASRAAPGEAGPLDALAAALAETGDFMEAASTARRAATLAEAGGREDLARALRDRGRLYDARHPYREPPPGAAPRP